MVAGFELLSPWLYIFRLRCAKPVKWGLRMKHFETTRQVNNPVRQGLVNHRKRVLRSRQKWRHEA
jgi:hypothetical protein